MPSPFRFGVQAAGPLDAKGWAAFARKAEDLGADVLTVADHVDRGPAPLPALMAAAAATSSLRLGTMVSCVDYMHPVFLAKETATVDLLSDGRLEVGVGAGWMASDYEQAGLRMDRPGVRISRLEEAITVLRGLWADGPFDFVGEHYCVTGLDGAPKPAQRPGPPIVVGGGGRRILELAARVADIVALNVSLASGSIDATSGPTGTAAATDEKLGWIRAAAGERFDAVTLHVRVHLASVTDDARGLADAVGPTLGLTPDEALESPHALAGSVTEIVETCLARRERWGISYLGINAESLDELAPVIDRLRGA